MSITIPVITVEGLSQHVISATKIGTRYYVTVDGATLENFESGFTPYEAIEYYIHVKRPTAIPFWNAAQAQLDAIISEEENRRERLAALNIFETPVCPTCGGAGDCPDCEEDFVETALEVEAPAADFDSIKAQISASLTITELQTLRETVSAATLSDYERNLLLWACDNAIRDIRTVEHYAAKQAARKASPAPEQIAWNDKQYKLFLLDI